MSINIILLKSCYVTWKSLLELMYIDIFWEFENIPIKCNQYNQMTTTISTVIIFKKQTTSNQFVNVLLEICATTTKGG